MDKKELEACYENGTYLMGLIHASRMTKKELREAIDFLADYSGVLE